ncbi:MAG: hypothetical protein D6766_13155 [Verrucomicrobia bacterium]|nr:MAG: hypothetical protein D6766_13155 [Verrucomicrobiota bacterium]
MKPSSTQLAVLCGLVCVATLHAQTTAFTYHGRLVDQGTPANGSYDLRFWIYDVEVDGSPVAGPVTHAATVVSEGLFTVTLDFGAEVFTGADRWLEYRAQQPRQLLRTAHDQRTGDSPRPAHGLGHHW